MATNIKLSSDLWHVAQVHNAWHTKNYFLQSSLLESQVSCLPHDAHPSHHFVGHRPVWMVSPIPGSPNIHNQITVNNIAKIGNLWEETLHQFSRRKQCHSWILCTRKRRSSDTWPDTAIPFCMNGTGFLCSWFFQWWSEWKYYVPMHQLPNVVLPQFLFTASSESTIVKTVHIHVISAVEEHFHDFHYSAWVFTRNCSPAT